MSAAERGIVGVFSTLVDGAWAKAAAGGRSRSTSFRPPWKTFLLKFSPFNLWMGVTGGTVMVMSTHGAEH